MTTPTTPSEDAGQVAHPRHVVLGVSGGIAAYKAAELLRRLTEAGHQATVVPTESALRFVGTATWEALSGRPVATGVFSDVASVPHVRLGQQASLVVVAPATADLLARAAAGRACDLLTATLLTARCPVMLAPAMHTEMWQHPATQDNVARLRQRGVLVLEPAVGRLTGADSGPGRLPEPEELSRLAVDLLDREAGSQGRLDLAGWRVVVSAGGTREPLDPVRFLGNRSSGRQGYAVARAALARGASVTLVAANTELPDPAGARVVRVETTGQMREAVQTAAADADAVVMAAAPADFRPSDPHLGKIKKSTDPAAPDGPVVQLTRTPDILAELAQDRPTEHQVVVGFAAETGDEHGSVLDYGRQKLAHKGCDLLVVNSVAGGAVFGSSDTEAVILHPHADPVPIPPGSKSALAHRLWDQVLAVRR